MDDQLESTLQLVRQAQAGDRGAMEALFSRYLPRVRQIVALRLGYRTADFGAHEDLVQDALLKTFENLEKYESRSDATFRNWIAQCVVNCIRDQARRSVAKKRGEGKVRPFGSYQSEDLDTIVFAQPGPSPSSICDRKEALERVEQALLEMKEHWREVIIQRLFCQMSYREVADAMGIAEESTVRKILSRALAELRRRCGY